MNNNSVNLPDAIQIKWLQNIAPNWSIPYLRLSRIDRPIGSWLLLIPCWWGMCLGIIESGSRIDLYDLWITIGCGVGAVLMRGAGCTWNDINDSSIDAQVERTKGRPIPAGQISVRKAAIWMLIQCLIALLILLTFPPFSILLGAISLLPVLIYPFAKRFTWWPQIFLGVAFNWGILLGFSTKEIGITTGCFCLYIAGIFWTLFYDTIYAFQDIEDDNIVGIKSTARLFNHNTIYWLFTFVLIFMILSSVAFYNSIFYKSHGVFLSCIAGLLMFCGHLFYQLYIFEIDKPKICLKLFRSNRNAGLIFLIFLLLGIFISLED